MTTPVRIIPEGIHALLSPSKAHQWLNCLGSLAATRDLPSKPASRYAAEGTVYHDVARRALLENQDCTAYIGDRYKVGEFEFTVDEDNAIEAQKYVDQVRAIPGKRYVEVDLDYHELLGVPQFHTEIHGSMPTAKFPVASGTGDAVILDYENRIIWGGDLKFGRGDIVYASTVFNAGTTAERREPNPQLGLYLAAAVARYELLGITDDWTAIGCISQPRVNHYDTHKMTVGELRAWTQEQRQKAQGAYALWCEGPVQPNIVASLTPGEKQCRWCPLSGNCAAQDQRILDRFPKGHAAAAIPTLVQLTDEQVAEALDLSDEIESWLSAVRSEGLARALRGAVLPNWKLVEGRRGNRTLNTEASVQLDVATLTEIGIEEAAEPSTLPVEDALHFALGDAAFIKKVKTVAQLQKPLEKKAPLLWAALQGLITQADGKPGLARMEDPRPPQMAVTAEFPVTPEPGKPSLV
jgi:hypothetical protein